MQKNIKLKILILVLFINMPIILFSQKPPEEFGKISIEDLKTTTCPIDSNAHAYFIFDYGNSYFQYSDTKISSDDSESSHKGFQLFFSRHFRIKIVDNQGFSWANIEIPLYHDGDEEIILQKRAYTYNLENNKIVKTKLENKDVFKEETSKYWATEKFAMPNVREGSIIEIEYTIKSDYYFNLREWYFQKTIPVLQSEYHVSIPEYFNFSQTQKGYFPIQRENDSRQKSITMTYHQKAEGISVQEQTFTNTYNYREDVYHYYAKEIPAFPNEEYLKTEDNYLSKFEFELLYTNFPNSPMKYYTTSWEKINENLLNDNSFGKELNKTSHTKNDVESLKQLNQKDFLLLNSAFNFIKNKLAWNGYKSKYATSTLSKAYKEGGGNCADINLNLILLLRELGFDAYPVIISTQENGIIHPAHPSISRFNYVIAMTKLGKDTLLMDATDPYSEINMLPIRCLNDKGRIVNNTGGDWITLVDFKPYSVVESYILVVNNNFECNGINQMILKDYAAYSFKKEIKKHNNIDEYKASLEKENIDFKIHEMNVVGLDTAQGNIKVSINFTQNNYLEQSKDIAFFKPSYHPFVSKNPFKLEKRDYPVEFNYPYSIKQIYSISIPENFTITEIPESMVLRTPDGKIRYIYSINQLGNNITLSVMFSISKTLFLPEEYQGLKDFYQMIVDKQNELIVIKTSK
jgi:hypothetical protein